MTSSSSHHHRIDLLRNLAECYQEFNGTNYNVLNEPPSPIEFMRLVHISRPIVIKNHIKISSSKWSNEYLSGTMGDRPISVAVTPNGRADAITRGLDGRNYFVEPCIEKMTMGDLLRCLDSEAQPDLEVYYLQSQNGNLYSSTSNSGESSEFKPLLQDVPGNVDWATKALGKSPDAVNIWIGNSSSVTSVHSDPYENIYTVMRGAKHFTLFPPTEGWCLQERIYPHATYTRETPGQPLAMIPSSCPPVRWSSVLDSSDSTTLPQQAKPLSITLEAGDTLYLPVGWWHSVRQTGLTIALNWWYDVEFRGMNWVWLNFLRGETEDVPQDLRDTEELLTKNDISESIENRTSS